jgi:ribosomal protein L24E
MVGMRTAVLPMAGAALVAAGCGGGSSGSGGLQPASTAKSVAAKPAPSGGQMPGVETGAALAIRQPRPGTVITANSVPFVVRLSHFKVDCRFAGTPDRPGVGHYHVMLDGALVNMFCSDRSRVSMQDVKPGRHTLAFVPADNTHADDLKAEKKVAFTYKPSKPLPAIGAKHNPGRPSIGIVSPRPGATVHGGFDLRVAPKNFEFSCALYGKKDIAGYGHWHANVDSTTKGMMGMGTMLGMSCRRSFHVSLAGIRPGKHTFYAILEDAQHAPTPNAQASVTLNVR